MRLPRNRKVLPAARTLRKNLTRQERHLWYNFLRYCHPRFRRQEIIGSYIADFYCHEAKLLIELDGSQHCEPEQRDRDKARTSYFHEFGIKVLRFSNLDIDRNFDGVCQAIILALEHCNTKASLDLEG